MRDLTLSRYHDLLVAFRSEGYRISGVAEWLRGDRAGRRVIMRHDVDRRVSKAVAMARLEATLGISSTYYLRCGRRGFPDTAIREISALGHEVGYHYETLSECRGDAGCARKRLADNLQRFRRIAPCQTSCAHGAPLSRFDNRELLQNVDLNVYGLIGDALLSFEDETLSYLTDTGGQFRSSTGPGNLRDGLRKRPPTYSCVARNVSELILLVTNHPGPFYLNVHPERWARNRGDMWYCVIADLLAGIGKKVIHHPRLV
jgi:hypothetical protein